MTRKAKVSNAGAITLNGVAVYINIYHLIIGLWVLKSHH